MTDGQIQPPALMYHIHTSPPAKKSHTHKGDGWSAYMSDMVFWCFFCSPLFLLYIFTFIYSLYYLLIYKIPKHHKYIKKYVNINVFSSGVFYFAYGVYGIMVSFYGLFIK